MLRLYKANWINNLSDSSITLSLFVLYCILVPIIMGFSSKLISHYHSGIIWLCFVLSLIPKRFFHEDFEDGSLEVFFLSRRSLEIIFITELISFWHLKILAIMISFPVLSFVFHFEQSFYLYINTILGSFALTLLLAFYSCLTLRIKSIVWATLQQFMVLPMLLPIILICVTLEANLNKLLLLFGFIILLVWISWVFLFVTLRMVLNN